MIEFNKSPYLVGFTTRYRPGKWYRGIRWALDKDFTGWRIETDVRRITLGRIVIDY